MGYARFVMKGPIESEQGCGCRLLLPLYKNHESGHNLTMLSVEAVNYILQSQGA